MSSDNEINIIVDSILQIMVTEFEERIINNKNETFYKIKIINHYNKTHWYLNKTYKEILILYNNLKKVLPEVPILEGNKIFDLFKSSKNYNTIMERKLKIQEFLSDCISRKDILSNGYFINFIDLKNNFPEFIYNSPEIIQIIDNDDMSLVDLIYIEKENILITISNDLNISSRMDSYLKNVDLVNWNKAEVGTSEFSENDLKNKNASKNKISNFTVFKIIIFKNNKNELKIKLEKIFVKYFDEIIGSLYYDLESSLFMIGLISGRLLFYKVLPSSLFSQFNFLVELKYHSSKITGIGADSNLNRFYTCEEEGNFYCGNIKMIHRNSYKPDLIHENEGGYSNMYLEKENNRIYLATNNGHLETYLINENILFISEIISSNDGYSLNDLYPYLLKHYLFSCSNCGKISVFDLCLPGQEKRTKELSYFDYYENNKVKIKTVIYDSDDNQVITGDDSGRIVFWSLKYGKPIFVYLLEGINISINKIRFVNNLEEKNKTIIVTANDNKIYFIRIPLKWLNNDDIIQYEQIEIKSRSDLNAMIKIQNFLSQDENYNSDEDSLNGWDYFANDTKEEEERQKNKKKLYK